MEMKKKNKENIANVNFYDERGREGEQKKERRRKKKSTKDGTFAEGKKSNKQFLIF
jgi:hypothetical protein